MAKKPWRVVQVGEDTGRFTREQIEAAVRAVRERKEAEQRSRPSSNRGGKETQARVANGA